MTDRNFQNPLAKVKGLGSAHTGTHHWIVQRISALPLIILGGWLIYNIFVYNNSPYHEVITWIANPWVASLLFLFIVTATYHAGLGIQVIIEDYIHTRTWRYTSLIILKSFIFSIPVFSLFLLIKIIILGNKL